MANGRSNPNLIDQRRLIQALGGIEQAVLNFLFECRGAYNLSPDDFQALGSYLYEHTSERAATVLRFCVLRNS